MPITMFDATEVRSLPFGSFAYAGYVGGKWPTYQEIKKTFPVANVLSIAIDASEDADCLDIETGDAVPQDAAAWYLRQLSRGVTRPCLYADAYTMREVLSVMRAASIPRDAVRLWSAHYTKSEHICGPATCGELDMGMDGTQWTDAARGISLDQSLLKDDFFSSTPSPVTDWQNRIMNILPTLSQGSDDASLSHWYVRRVQAILNDIYGNKLTVDGKYGPITKAAVENLQKASGITEDGVTGPDTWAVILTGEKS